MEDVKVHKSSSSNDLGADAHAQANQIEFKSTKEKHLGHELSHAQQQKGGRTKG